MRKIYSLLVAICAIVFGISNNIFADELTVANTTSYTNSNVPIYGSYVDSKIRCQVVYPPSDLSEMSSMVGKNITGIKFYLKSTSTFNGTFYVRLAEISGTGFDSKVWFTDVLTEVYSGTITPSSTLVTINFSTPYLYSGGNLLVDIQTKTTGTWNATTYYGSTMLTTKQASAWAYNGSVTNPYQTEWFLPKTTFTYETATPLTCPKPVNLTGSASSTTSANITWERKGTETAWNLQYSSNGGSTWTTLNLTTSNVAVVGDDCSYTLSGLSGETTYTIKVQADCGGGDESAYSSEASFTTPCGKKSLPWFEGFESYSVGSYSSTGLSSCWDVLNNSTTYSSYPQVYVNSATDFKKTGSRSLYFISSSTTYEYVILPEFETTIDALKISFSYKFESGATARTLTLGYMTDPSNASTFHVVKTYSHTTSWTDVTNQLFESIPAADIPTARIAFRYGTGTSNYYLGLDDITVSSSLDCSTPSVTGITETTATSAKLTWTKKSGVTSYQYCVVESGDPADWSGDLTTSNNYATVSGLTPGDYDFYVKCLCGDEPTSAAYSFSLSCSTPGVPVFSSPTADGGHVAWTAASGGVTTYQYCIVASGSPADWSGNLTVATNSKDLTGLTAGNNYTFYVRSKCADGIYSDAVSCTVSPACPTPSGITFTNQTYNSARVTWTNGGGESAWNLRYKAGSGSWSTPVRLTSRTYDLTDLTVGVTYTVEVQADCDGTWTSNTYTPECPTPGAITLTNKTHSGVRVTWVAGGTEDSWNLRYRKGSDSWTERNGLTSRTCDLTGLVTDEEYTIEITAACCSGGTRSTTYTPICATPASATISAITDVQASASWSAAAGTGITTFQYIVVARDATPDWSAATTVTATSATLTGLTVATNYDFYVRSKCADGNFSESLKRQFATVTKAPTSVVLNEATSDGGRFSWSAGGAETRYQWKTNAAGSEWSEPLAAGVRTVTVTGLSPRTNYTFYVRSYYTESVQSAAVTKAFTTTCGAESMPFVEDFNSLASGIPDCWDNAEGTTTTDSYKWNYTTSGHSGNGVRFNSYSNSSGKTNFLKTPQVNITESATLLFWYKNPTGGDFSVYYTIDGGALNTIATGLTGKTAWTKYTYKLPDACIDHRVVIIFKGTSNYGTGDAYIYLDDVEIKNCDDVTIYFDACDGKSAYASSTASRCTGVVLPSTTGTCTGWTLAGWATEPIMESTASPAVTIYPAGSTLYAENNNDTLYAVYAKTTGSSNYYDRVTSAAGLTIGSEYLVVKLYGGTYYALKNTNYASGKQPTGKTVSPSADVITNTDAAIVWQINGSSLSNCKIYNAAANVYLSMTAVDTYAAVTASTTDNFTIATYGDNFSVKSNVATKYKYLNYSGSSFDAYTTAYEIIIYKRRLNYNYNSYPCSKEVEAQRWGSNWFAIESLDYDAAPTIKSSFISEINASGGLYDLTYNAKPGTRLVFGWGDDMYRVNVPVVVTTPSPSDLQNGKDLVISDGTELTLDEDLTVHNLTIYEGGGLTIASGTTLTVDTLILCTWLDVTAPSIRFESNTSALVVNSNTIYHDRRIDWMRYYMLALPFNSRLSDIRYAGLISNSTISAPVYFTDYYVQYYDGVSRSADAAGGERQLKPTYWTHVVPKTSLGDAATFQLQAGRGYTIGISDKAAPHNERTLRFKMTAPAGWNNTENGTTDKVITIDPSKVIPTGADIDANRHSGWNFIGNPYLHNYSPTTATGLKTGNYELNDKGYYEIDEDGETDIPYITFYNSDYETYEQQRVSESTIKPFSTAFIQVEDNDQLRFSTSLDARSALPAYRRAPEKQQTVYTGISLYNEQDNKSDRTGLVISDHYTTNYEIGGDLIKMRGGKQLSVFSIIENTELAFNAIDSAYASKTIPLGVYLPQKGDYTFTFDDNYNIGDVKEIWLTDYQENITTNLLWEDYYFTADKGTYKQRFALSVVLSKRSPNIATDTETTDGSTYCYATTDGIVVSNLSAPYDIYIFDMAGKKVASRSALTGKQHFALPQGVYNVLIYTQSEQHTERHIVR